MRIVRTVLAVALSAVVALSAGVAAAQAYPIGPVRIVVPFTAGGGVDILGRLLAAHLKDAWNQSVVVENRPGANGNIGAELVAKAPPDGHTLLMGYDGTLVIGPLVSNRTPFETLRDFEPVSKVTDVPLVIVARPNLPAKSLAELIALAKSRPGELNFATSGTGSTPHMAGELIKLSAGIDMVHVPYKGGAAGLADVLGGQLDLLLIAIPPVQAHISQGKLGAIAVTSARRSAALPAVPTVAESGLPGFDVPTWFGVLAPKGTPSPVVGRIHAEIVAMLRRPDIRERFAGLGMEPVGSTPEEFAAQIRADSAAWAKVVERAKIRAD